MRVFALNPQRITQPPTRLTLGQKLLLVLRCHSIKPTLAFFTLISTNKSFKAFELANAPINLVHAGEK
jgi:hypothetical protein